MGLKRVGLSAILNGRSRAPLSYRHLRILGWLCIAVSQIGVLLDLASVLNLAIPNAARWSSICNQIGVIAVPLFLLANFAVILNGSKKHSGLLLMYGGFSLAICFCYYFAVSHYLFGLLSAAAKDGADPHRNLELLLRSISPSGFLAFNVFLDLFLCTVFSYFVFERPKKFFPGKKLRIFRAFAVIPVLYEVVSVLLKVLTSVGRIDMPVWLFPLLTTKPPMMFLLFVGLVLIIKLREQHSEKDGQTPEGSEASVRSYVNTRRFSLALMGLMIVAALLDLLLKHVLPCAIVDAFPAGADIPPYEAAKQAVSSWGFGSASLLLFLAPFSLLISFSKTYKKSMIDMSIPIIGVALIVFIVFEGLFQIIRAMLLSSP